MNGISAANPYLNAGWLSRIDISGDSVVTSAPAGIGPVHATITSGGRVYVANNGDDTVFASPVAANSHGTIINLVQLCSGASCPPVMPVFVTTTQSNRLYVAGAGNGTVSVIDTGTNVVINTYAVAPAHVASPLPSPDTTSQPVALAELPNGSRIYSANKGSNTVSSINTQDGSINAVIPLTAAPIWIVANVDNTHVYVLDTSDTISVIDTTTDTIVSSVPAGPGGGNLNQIVYDPILNRVYATDSNSAPPTLRLFDVASQGNQPNATLVPHGSTGKAVIQVAPGSQCASTPVPTSVTVLGDGSRAYVASYQDDGTQICTQATVVDTATGLATKILPLSQTTISSGVLAQTNCDLARPNPAALGGPFRVYAASSPGGTNSLFKVYVSQCDAGTVAVIDTFALGSGPNPHPADWFAGWMPSPVSSFPSSQVSITAVSATAPATCPTATPVTYSYSLLSGPALQPGMTVYISGMAQSANDGAFPITAATSSTFTVNNSCPAQDTSAQNANGSVIPSQNPVFLVPGP